MAILDLPEVLAVAAVVHPDFPEQEAVFAERLRLFPAGCRVLADLDDRTRGYLVSHPWHAAMPVPLDTLLQQIPRDAATLYVHDLALLPAARGSGAAGTAVGEIVETTRQLGLAHASLVAVNRSAPFWQRHGFQALRAPAFAQLRSYGNDAVFMVRAANHAP
jgi:GNAT superfamily N-acetyltransferase